MQAPFGTPTSPTLAVCGWTERTPALLRALEARSLLPVAIGDPSAAALAAAAIALRGRFYVPARYQHPREMIRRGPGATVLIDLPDAAMEAAAAARRGTAVLVAGDAIEPDTLDMLARTGATASILRPLWSRAPLTAASDAVRCLSRLRSAIITVEEPRPARAIADDLVALALQLAGAPVRLITATAYGPRGGATESVITELEFNGGVTVLLAARSAPRVHIGVELSSFSTTIEVDGDETDGSLTVTTAGRSTVTTFVEGDRHALAVEGALDELAAGGVEANRLFAEATLLRRLDSALNGLATQPPPALSLVAGGGQASAPRRGHLHLVGV